MPRREEGHQHLGFDFEVFRAQRQSRPGFQMDEAKTALRVGQVAGPRGATVGGSSSGSPAGAAREWRAHRACGCPITSNAPRFVRRIAERPANPPARAGRRRRASQPIQSLVCSACDNPVLSASAFAEIPPVTHHHCAGARRPGWSCHRSSRRPPPSPREDIGATAATRGAMVVASLKQGITAAHDFGSKHQRSLTRESARKSRQNFARQNQSNADFALPDDGVGLYFGIELNDASYACKRKTRPAAGTSPLARTIA